MKIKTPDEMRQAEILRHVKDVLGDSYVHIEPAGVEIKEDLLKEETEVRCEAMIRGEIVQIEATGSGVIDALFQGIRTVLAQEYCSLEEISFEDFIIDINPATRKKREGTDVSVFVELIVRNSRDVHHHFHSEAKSFNVAAIRAVLDAIGYYVNCELAVVRLSELLRDAKKRNRADLLRSYTNLLSEVVQNTSYEKTIVKWRQKN